MCQEQQDKALFSFAQANYRSECVLLGSCPCSVTRQWKFPLREGPFTNILTFVLSAPWGRLLVFSLVRTANLYTIAHSSHFQILWETVLGKDPHQILSCICFWALRLSFFFPSTTMFYIVTFKTPQEDFFPKQDRFPSFCTHGWYSFSASLWALDWFIS